MILSTTVLNLVGILVIASYKVKVVDGSDEADEENSLKQALFLVELLKSDFAKVLRENEHLQNDVEANSTEDTNTTCAIPLEDFNTTTTAINEKEERVSGVSSASPSEGSTATPQKNPVTQSVTPVMPALPFSSWPPMPMGYPPPLAQGRQGNFPDENYRFPYRFNRRRMMPDYYYFDSPLKNRGFRRLNSNDPTDDTASSFQKAFKPSITDSETTTQTTTYIPSTTRAATTVHIEETTTTAKTVSTTMSESTTSLPPTQPSSLPLIQLSSLPTIQPSILLTTEPSTLPTTELSMLPTTEQSMLPITDQSMLPTTEQSMLPTTEQSMLPTTKQSILPTNEQTTQRATEPSNLLTKSRKGVRVRTHMPVSKARATIISNHHEKLKLNIVDGHHLRHQKTEKYSSGDVEMSQVASELIKEFKGTKTKNISNIFRQSKKDSKLNSKKKHSTTMKIYLKGSSRLPVPLPENNAFCHSYPHNALCGTML